MASPLATALALQQPIVSPSRPPVAPTDVLGAYKLSTDAANQQYLAKLQQQNALWGGLAGLGSAGILSLPRLLAMKGATGAPAASGAAASLPADLSAPLAGADIGSGTALAGDLGSTAALDAGTSGAVGGIGADLAAAAPVADTVAADTAAAAVPAAADAAGFSLADLLPFLFAA